MKKKLTVLIILFSVTFGYSQDKDFFELLSDRVVNLDIKRTKEISEVISQNLNNTNLDLRINRLALATGHYKLGENIRIVARFSINEAGRLINISVSNPIPEIVQVVTNELKNVSIPIELLNTYEKYFADSKFNLPILLQITKEADLLKFKEKEKRRKKREEEKELRKKKRRKN